MLKVSVDFGAAEGAVKPMHAVNNGPVYRDSADQSNYNLLEYREAGFPYARTHDSSFYSTYGGEHTVDVIAIFPDFDADENDPASYDFACTDEYLRVISLTGTKVFYRLGNRIEHAVRKYGTLPPKDFGKWARVCEHIIRHYTEGWANGFCYDIPYWEIWNEPDLNRDDAPVKLTWGGDREQFFRFYDVTARHLKSCFPHLKIGGPAIAGNMEWAEDFLSRLSAPLDFFSWHIYATEPAQIVERALRVRGMLDGHGFRDAESILDEWNFVRSFAGKNMVEAIRVEKSLKGAAFNAAVMAECQREAVDMLMYYDARPCGMNGLFDTDIVSVKLKGYYSMKAFNELYKLGTSVRVEAEAPLYAVAAVSGDGSRAALLITNYSDGPAVATDARLEFRGLGEGARCRGYVLDETRDLEFCGEGALPPAADISLAAYETVLLTVER